MIEAIVISSIVVLIVCGSALYFSRHEPLRNGYQSRRRSYVKGARVRIISEAKHPVIGDGAWATTPAEYPREPERMGF